MLLSKLRFFFSKSKKWHTCALTVNFSMKKKICFFQTGFIFFLSLSSIDKLWKIRNCFELFKSQCKVAFEPYSQICVDEELYPFRETANLDNTCQRSLQNYGIKFWCLCDVKTSFLCNVDIYLSRNESKVGPLGEHVVKTLSAPFFTSNRNLIINGFFTSIPLANFLWHNGLTVTAILRKNKPDIPSSFQAPQSLLSMTNCQWVRLFLKKTNQNTIILPSLVKMANYK